MFLPATYGVVLKYSFDGLSGFRFAIALPLPAFDLPGQAVTPELSRVATEQVLRPLVFSLRVAGKLISI